MRILLLVLAVLSLLACLGSGVAHFLGKVTFNGYTSAFILFSVVYFVSAATWAEMSKR